MVHCNGVTITVLTELKNILKRKISHKHKIRNSSSADQEGLQHKASSSASSSCAISFWLFIRSHISSMILPMCRKLVYKDR